MATWSLKNLDKYVYNFLFFFLKRQGKKVGKEEAGKFHPNTRGAYK